MNIKKLLCSHDWDTTYIDKDIGVRRCRKCQKSQSYINLVRRSYSTGGMKLKDKATFINISSDRYLEIMCEHGKL